MFKKLYRWIKSKLSPVGAFAPEKSEKISKPKLRRYVDEIIIHCTASDYPYHDNVESVFQWHVRENGWSDIGYHYLITKDGKIHSCRPVERIGAHCFGRNAHSIGVCLTGKTVFSDKQFRSLKRQIAALCDAHSISPDKVYPHSKFANKKCPNFDIKEVL